MSGLREPTSRRAVLRAAAGGVLMACGFATSACAAPNNDGSRITFLTGEDSTDTQAVWRRMFDDFIAANPAVHEIVPEYLNPDQALSRLATLVNTGSPPDIAKFDDAMVAVLAHSGALEPVTDVVDELDPPETARLRLHGEDYFIPTDLGSSLTYYRRDWFDEAGISEAPKNWTDYLAAAHALTDRSRRRFGDLVVSNGGSGYTKNVVLNHTWANGVDYFRWDGRGWTISLPQYRAKAAETLEWFLRRSAYSPETADYDYSDATQAFASGAVGLMEYPGARPLAYIAKEFPDVFQATGIAPLPYQSRPAHEFSNGGLVIFRKPNRSPHPLKELALSMAGGPRYLEYLWSVPGQLIPPNKALFDGAWRTHEFIRSTPGLLTAIDDSYASGYSPLSGPATPAGADANIAGGAIYLSTIYSELLSKTITDEQAPADVVDHAVIEMQDYVDEMN